MQIAYRAHRAFEEPQQHGTRVAATERQCAAPLRSALPHMRTLSKNTTPLRCHAKRKWDQYYRSAPKPYKGQPKDRNQGRRRVYRSCALCGHHETVPFVNPLQKVNVLQCVTKQISRSCGNTQWGMAGNRKRQIRVESKTISRCTNKNPRFGGRVFGGRHLSIRRTTGIRA
jgi:hypothetical protein